MNSDVPNKTSLYSKVSYHIVDEGSVGQRLDNFLLKTMRTVPKKRVYQMIRKGEVRINKKRGIPSSKLELNDAIRIPPFVCEHQVNQVTHIKPELTELLESAIVYEDVSLLVIDKPSGLAVHGGSNISLGLIEALRLMRPKQKLLELVHRLDKETSGLVMIAKKRSMLTYLHECLRIGSIQKNYIALVPGFLVKEGKIDAPLLKKSAPNGERMVVVNSAGKASLTHIKILNRNSEFTLLQASPKTGRTHQIRVHLAHYHDGIIGDEKYGDKTHNEKAAKMGFRRLFLHASHLTIPLEGQHEPLRLEAPLPDQCKQFLSSIKLI